MKSDKELRLKRHLTGSNSRNMKAKQLNMTKDETGTCSRYVANELKTEIEYVTFYFYTKQVSKYTINHLLKKSRYPIQERFWSKSR